MSILAKNSFGFTTTALHQRREPHAFHYLTERATFWIAVISVFAFVTGNMIGTHGFRVFWRSVLGEGIESTIAFTGTVPPIDKVPSKKWRQYGGDIRVHTFRQVPADMLVPLPAYNERDSSDDQRHYFYVSHLGTYATGRGEGSHPGEDIAAPVGTPVRSIANGIVYRVDDDTAGYGKFIVVKHPNVPDSSKPEKKTSLYSVYAHLSEQLVTEGTVVQKGELIGLTGMTGFATGPHLHFQLDRDSAPYHPFWPFTGAEARKAGLSFSQAIDAGLHRERGVEHTADPMLFVQAYKDFAAPVVAQGDTGSSQSSVARSVRSRPMTVAQRREARVAKRGTLSTVIAFVEDAPVIPIPESSSTSSSSSNSSSSLPSAGAVHSIRITHDGAFGKERGWERVTLQLLDSDGRVVTKPSSEERIVLKTAFGRADFRPAEIALKDFRNGVMTVEMLPLGQQTVVVEALPLRAISKPMQYVGVR